MKKGIVILLTLFIFVFCAAGVFAIAANTNSPTDSISAGYQCLQTHVVNKTTLSEEESVFTTLALGKLNSSISKIDSEKSTTACWPKEGCTIKDTAQAVLAYNRIGRNTTDGENWLISKNATLLDLAWYLELDINNHVPAQCTISYDNSQKTIAIDDNMQITGDPGSCFTIIPSGYWLAIRPSCFDKKFDISCTEDFISTLLYSKGSGQTIYVSSTTHSAASSGTTSESIGAKCLKTGGTCDYEGTLWAALALQKTGHDIEPYIPYLLALGEDNTKYFPSSFLYLMLGGDEQYSDIIQLQKQKKFWEMVATPYNKFYDTGLGMSALYGTSATEFANAQDYMVNIQQADGCWNNDNIRDTAFVLYSGWPQTVATENSGSTNNNNSTVTSNGQLDVSLILPYDGEIFNRTDSLPLNFTVYGTPDSCWYSLDNGNNNTITNCLNTTFSANQGDHVMRLYVKQGNNSLYDRSNFEVNITAQATNETGAAAGGGSTGTGTENGTTNQTTGTGGGTMSAACESAGYYCGKATDCNNAGGTIVYDFDCAAFGDFCCTVPTQAASCQSQGGIICSSNQQCVGSSSPSSDGTCCLQACQDIPDQTTQNTCTGAGYTCAQSCSATQNSVTEFTCDGGQVCCSDVTTPAAGTTSSTWKWVMIILVVLVILVILAIVFRNRIAFALAGFRNKGSAKSTPMRRMPPGAGAGFEMPRMMPRPMGQPGQQQQQAPQRPMVRPSLAKRVGTDKDKEFDETLRKLKEMSK